MMTNTKKQTNLKKPIKIIGLGNYLYSDEGLGVHIIPLVEEAFNNDPLVEVIEGSTDGLRLLDPIEDTEGLLVIDAIVDHRDPGDLIVLEGEDVPKYFSMKMSVHQMGFQEVLQAADIRGHYPDKVAIIGLQPSSLELGTELSPLIQSKLPLVVEELKSILQRWKGEWHESA